MLYKKTLKHWIELVNLISNIFVEINRYLVIANIYKSIIWYNMQKGFGSFFHPTQEFFTYMEMSPFTVKFYIYKTCKLSIFMAVQQWRYLAHMLYLYSDSRMYVLISEDLWHIHAWQWSCHFLFFKQFGSVATETRTPISHSGGDYTDLPQRSCWGKTMVL